MRHLFLFLAASILIGGALARADDQDEGGLSYLDFLSAAGEKLGCYFTVEKWKSTEHHLSCFDAKGIRDEKLATIDALIAKLKRDIPGAEVVRDRRNGRIFHLIEKGLLKQKGYVMEEEAAVAYSGALGDLPDALGKVVPGISQYMGGVAPYSLVIGSDSQTTVKVSIKKKEKVRQILSDAVPLKNYCRLIWTAGTSIENGKPQTSVLYYGSTRTDAK